MMQRVTIVADDDGVACVGAALEASDDIELLAEKIDQLAFALVAPLGAHDRDVWHLNPVLASTGTERSYGSPAEPRGC